MIEVINNVATVVGCASVAFGLTCSISKTVRSRFTNLFCKKEAENERDMKFKKMSNKIDEMINMLSDYSKKSDETDQMILKSIESLKRGSAISLGDIIRRIYNTYKDEKKIPEKEYSVVEKAYDVYHNELGGNGTIEHIYNEITTTWEVIID